MSDCRGWIARYEVVVPTQIVTVFCIPGIEPGRSLQSGKCGARCEPCSCKLRGGKSQIGEREHRRSQSNEPPASGSMKWNLHFMRQRRCCHALVEDASSTSSSTSCSDDSS